MMKDEARDPWSPFVPCSCSTFRLVIVTDLVKDKIHFLCFCYDLVIQVTLTFISSGVVQGYLCLNAVLIN